MNQYSAPGTYEPPASGWQHSSYPPPPWGQARSPRPSGQSIAVLCLGIASLTVFWGLAGIAALVLSRSARREIAASGGAIGGDGLIKAGVICSWISIALTVLAAMLVVAVLLVLGAGAGGVDTVVDTTPGPFSITTN